MPARLLYLASEQVPSKDTQAQLVAQALAGFDQAIAVGPDYADAYYFRAVLYAATERARPLAGRPPELPRARARTASGRRRRATLLAQVTTALEAPSTTVPPTVPPRPKKH